ncbi:PKD domain-containing protein [Aureibaculum marinum]|uniref:PKD domain-containing protein n=1 Tax=Aureibaculum marinum TaxID=2487930 RepID=A0A3N4P8E2_9FLAO|nr:PKD domain-containing protein [Aureibaculum marinum]RPD99979.1 PKD domain-containing protein [Aureibaculum marinum]
MKTIIIKFLLVGLLILVVACDQYEDYNVDVNNPTAIVDIASQDGYNVKFSNDSKDAKSYLWDFGDGATSTEKNPDYTYEIPGEWTVHFSAFSDGYFKASIDSLSLFIEGTTGEASNFVGEYTGTVVGSDGSAKTEFTTTTTLVNGENAVMFGNLLKSNRTLYESWGYNTFDGTDDYAKIVFKENGVIDIPLQYMYVIDGYGYHDSVYIRGRGRYNADTGSLALEYIELFEGDGLDWDGTTITEKVLIARKN